MLPEPPPFEEANRCHVCNCSFSTFRRRHHCRCCGRTLCYEHSSNQMPLPQYGIHTNVRVCADCFNDSSRNDHVVARAERVDLVTDTVSRLDINGDSGPKTELTPPEPPVSTNLDCKCGMPLCICQATFQSSEATALMQTLSAPSTSLDPKPKKTEAIAKNRRSTPDTRKSSTASGSGKPQADYEVNGEGLREAIKNGDIGGVKDLLNKDVDSNYCDKQGFSLLHLAAMFNQTDIAFALMDHGARPDSKNSQGETPLDCAPATLQYKMQKKIEEEIH